MSQMDNQSTFFKDVTLLITHYNRSSSLARLLKTVSDLQLSFEDIVVSDDGSRPEHLCVVKELNTKYPFRLITTEKNKGLANNLNKGQDAVKTIYTLYVQEDFIPTTTFAQHFKDALDIMQDDNSIDLIRFYAYIKYPYLKPFKKGFSEVKYRPWFGNTNKIYAYSDHPHLRRSSFFSKFGRYVEGIKSDKGEYKMCISFIRNKGKALFYNDYKSLFKQENSSEEPSTVKRSDWRLSNNFLIAFIRNIYRQIKFNYDIHI